jgi:hypothetical protein
MARYESPLRDMARKLRTVAREHLAYSQVADFMNHIDDHLNALAFAEETNRREHERERQAGGGGQCVPQGIPDGDGPARLLP